MQAVTTSNGAIQSEHGLDTPTVALAAAIIKYGGGTRMIEY